MNNIEIIAYNIHIDSMAKSVDTIDFNHKPQNPTIYVISFFDEVLITPVISTTDACLNCLFLRLSNNYKKRKQTRELIKAYLSGTSIQNPDITPLTRHLIAALLAKKTAENNTEQLTVISLKNHKVSHHTLISHPDCEVCDSLAIDEAMNLEDVLTAPDKIKKSSYRTQKIDDIQTKIDPLLDTRTGIFNTLLRDYNSPFAVAVANMPLSNGMDEPGIGRTTNYEASSSVAMLEGLERYCGLSNRGKRDTVRSSYTDLIRHHLVFDPRQLPQHSEQQFAQSGFPFRPFDENHIYDWVWGYSFKQKAPILIPKFCAYYYYFHKSNYDNAPFYEISNGCALGGCLEEAIIHGIFEVIERDAFLMTWFKRLVPSELFIDQLYDEELIHLKWRFEAETGYNLRFFDISQEGPITTIMVLAEHPDESNLIKQFCACGAHTDPLSAAKGAIHEVAGILTAMQTKFLARQPQIERMLNEPKEVRSMEDHALVNAHPLASERFDFLKKGQKKPLQSINHYHDTIKEDLHDITSDLLDNFSDVIVVDQSSQELRKRDLSCVKVIIPDCLPMTFGYDMRRTTQASRLSNLRPQEINPHPHPFP